MIESASSIGTSWYVLQTKPRQEFRALEQLENQLYTCFLPTLQIEKVRRGKLEVVIEPLFSRYLFIQLDTVSSNWARLRSTRGVSKLVAFGDRFATISEVILNALGNARPPIPTPLFAAGEKVAIKSGPFSGLDGVFQMLDGESRALVLIELLSQPQKLAFELDTLRKIA
ncbi:transcription/translation regulatory transformer protein RfaH [Paraherbaspirillum soli]|uniref:Transcription/translation regulatory transformer protein RfaH n=1 Tax=Paraherbaspirillum soli TaxID=631222 RepID=A0ABW0M909_9BURK